MDSHLLLDHHVVDRASVLKISLAVLLRTSLELVIKIIMGTLFLIVVAKNLGGIMLLWLEYVSICLCLIYYHVSWNMNLCLNTILSLIPIDGRKYKANANTDLELPDGSSFYNNPTNPVVTNVCYPTDANAIDFRSDGSSTPLSETGNGGCRSNYDPVCGPDDNTCLSYESFNCRCDYDGTFGGNGNGVPGFQAGNQIATWNNGICGRSDPAPTIGAGNTQPSDYVDAAACWYDTSDIDAMSKYWNDLLYS